MLNYTGLMAKVYLLANTSLLELLPTKEDQRMVDTILAGSMLQVMTGSSATTILSP